MACIGIDLGTTNSCVAILQNDKPEVIAEFQGKRIIPSCVSFTGQQILVGTQAKRLQPRNTKNTIYSIKRIIGRKYEDPVVQVEKERMNFEIVEKRGKPGIRVTTEHLDKTLYPEQISAMVLSRMKEIAEKYLDHEVFSAVITVPAYFNDGQRVATIHAAQIAGLNVLKLVNEPTAAALAFGFREKFKKPKNVLVYDLGGGTFDVTVLTIKGDKFDVKSTAGDVHLGGEEFNQTLFDYFIAEYNSEHGERRRTAEFPKNRMLPECERVKVELSTSICESVQFDGLFPGKDFECTVNRAKFDELNAVHFSRTLQLVEEALSSAKIKKSKIDHVLLVGGSTRIPRVREMLIQYFGEEKIRMTVNADEAVALGAAIQAAMLSKESIPQVENLSLKDVIPQSVGIKVRGGAFSVIIEKNTEIPVRKVEKYATTVNNQTSVQVEVYEGDSQNIRDNHFLGRFTLRDLPKRPAGKVLIDVWIEININGVLHVSAVETSTEKSENINIDANQYSLTNEEILAMTDEASDFRRNAWRERTVYVKDLEFRAERLREQTRSTRVRATCTETLTWAEQNQGATISYIFNKRQELEEVVESECQ